MDKAMDDKISVKEAYVAMFSLLEELYAKYEFDQLGGLLGSLSLLPDGSPADQAIWADWINCVQRSREGRVNVSMHIDGKVNDSGVQS